MSDMHFDTSFPQFYSSFFFLHFYPNNTLCIKKVLTLFKDLDTEGDKRSPQHRQQADDNVIAYHRHDQILADKSEESELSGDGGSDTISGYHSDSDHSNSNANGSSMNNDIHPSGSIVKSPSSESFGIKTGSEGEKSFIFEFIIIHLFFFLFIQNGFNNTLSNTR